MQDRQDIQNKVKEVVQQKAMDEAQKKILLDAKTRVQNVIEFIEDLEKRAGSTKQSKKAKQVMNKFLKCHITSPAIFKRYQEVMILMERYANANQA